MSPRTPSRPPARGRIKVLSIIAALGLFVCGIYFGVELAKPPPPPDLAAIRLAPPPPSPSPPSPAPQPDVQQPDAPSTDAPQTDASQPAVPAPTPPAPLEVRRQPAPAPASRPRLAIVIDDLGRSVGHVESLGRLGVPFTYAVLPFETQTPQVVAALQRRGSEILCHLPMEPKNGANPGPGALRLDMSHEEMLATTRRALAAVPGAMGVNNHMGSAVTSHRAAIAAVMEVVLDEGLYYLDSRTSPDTLGYSIAHTLGIPAGERQVFLDNDRDPAAIRAQLAHLKRVATERGGAIAIAHPYPETIAILAEEIPAAQAAGFDFVPVSMLLDTNG